MTSSGDTGSSELPRPHLAAAEKDLARVREILESAARGEAGGDELSDAVQGYLDEHGAALRATAAALSEETRLQTLQELYKMRARLDAQLKARKRAP